MKRAFLKVIDDEIVGKNLRPVALDALDLLITLTTNAIQSKDKRKIRLSNTTIQKRLVSVTGAIPYLQACKWYTQVADFEEYLVFSDQPTETQLDTLILGSETIRDRCQILKDNFNRTELARKAGKEDDDQRKARALQAIREDRLTTQARAEREKAGRDAKTLLREKEAAAMEAEGLAALEPPSSVFLIGRLENCLTL